MAQKLELKLRNVLPRINSFDSFVHDLLADTLGWDIQQGVRELEDIAHDWSEEDLRLEGLSSQLVGGRVWQIQPLPVDEQPWGVFLLEFNSPDAFVRGRGMAGPLRQVLRGLVPRRKRAHQLPAWQHENLLFICTHGWRHFTFAHFKGERAASAAITTFGWVQNQAGWRTLCEANLPALRWPDDPSDRAAWQAQWAGAFDKEALTRRFFKQFRHLCGVVAEDILRRNRALGVSHDQANTEAQILLERLLFLYFIQRKGWLDQKADYLVREFNANHRGRPGDTSFYQSFLTVVFRRLSSRQMQRQGEIGCLPFLNGGLFEEDPGAFQDGTTLRLALKVGNGVLATVFDDLLEHYNFTIREDTPLDQDVAVDPEMLGKILECLVLEMESAEGESAPDKRKATGSYYTPRIVVHFICREVLRQFLLARLEGSVATSDSPVGGPGGDTCSASGTLAATAQNWPARLNRLFAIDPTGGITAEQLEELRSILTPHEAERIRKLVWEIKACDPAVGSGAFAVGLLHELVNLTVLCETAERGKDPRISDENYLHEVKKHFIQNAIYGVDILERAAEICKLRLWLSLVVDYQLPVDPFRCTPGQFAAALEKIPPLPNLDFKIRRGDSLLDQIHGQPILMEEFARDQRASALIAEMRELKEAYFKDEDIRSKRADLRKLIAKRLDLADLFITQQVKRLSQVQQVMFGETKEDAERRRWREARRHELNAAQAEVWRARERLAAIRPGGKLSRSDEVELRKLDGQIGDRLSFVWRLDFMEVFNRPAHGRTFNGKFAFVNVVGGQKELAAPSTQPSGFDIIVGNPPFVHCSNPTQRKGLADNYRRVFDKNAQLAAYFIVRAFELLDTGGLVSFIVADGFAVARFGEWIVTDFLPQKNLIKVMSTGGFNLEGHGTATLIFFASKSPPFGPTVWLASSKKADKTRGSIEARPIWRELLSASGPEPFEGEFFSGRAVPRSMLARHPWPVNLPGDIVGTDATDALLSRACGHRLAEMLRRRIGSMFVTRLDDVFLQPPHVLRRAGVPVSALRPCLQGEFLRDWSILDTLGAIFPYDEGLTPISESARKNRPTIAYLSQFKPLLEQRKAFGQTQIQAGLKWFAYNMLMRAQFTALAHHHLLAYPTRTTSFNHWSLLSDKEVAQDSIQVATVKEDAAKHALLGFLNSSACCFLMKKRGKPKRQEADPLDQYFDYDGTAVGRVPVPQAIASALSYRGEQLAGGPGSEEGETP